MTYTKENFCFHKSIFQWQIKLVSHRREFWYLRRKTAVTFSKWLFFQNSLAMSWATWSDKMQAKKWTRFLIFLLRKNSIQICIVFKFPVFIMNMNTLRSFLKMLPVWCEFPILCYWRVLLGVTFYYYYIVGSTQEEHIILFI